MTLLEKIKINLDYLLGKADSSLYAPPYKGQKIGMEEWSKRWEIFANDGCGYLWYGIDSQGSLAEFSGESSYVPEVFFQDISNNKQLLNFFANLPENTTGRVPDVLRKDIKPSPEKVSKWSENLTQGIFSFYEPNDIYWYDNSNLKRYEYKKTPYELMYIPNVCLKLKELPTEIQKLLQPYYFENLKFEDCQFLDVSKHLHCEE